MLSSSPPTDGDAMLYRVEASYGTRHFGALRSERGRQQGQSDGKIASEPPQAKRDRIEDAIVDSVVNFSAALLIACTGEIRVSHQCVPVAGRTRLQRALS
ncbi:hypothetical protein ACVIHI_006110 [Bradyrhizobium sp. USDA 4524]|uniref:hypothetical protein n=1 Tax=unclassified Bradyrhizobium TaxID=2631580 RepID=UPI00209F727A|nr:MULTISPECIES: hypothetical protein [unclassified Bradyrhizobium]MCP1840972.1 hypothetical protein [Bradyrhizobium sp. USDA 4538]MCP1901535.1 hypothetical protein [Bradyrhizobium sp. USDA 4537]MCP1992809.1 hypothetical protein [Bradyrhizobium sp. USDA 4539]